MHVFIQLLFNSSLWNLDKEYNWKKKQIKFVVLRYFLLNS